MRTAAIVTLSLLLTGCGNPFQVPRDPVANNQQQSPPPAVVAARADGDQCAYQWNGNGVTAAQLQERVTAAVGEDLERQGGPANIEALLPIDAEITPQLPHRCFAGLLRALQRTGVMEVRVSLSEGGERRPAPTLFLIAEGVDPPPPQEQRNVLAIDARGEIAWNRQAIDRTTLTQYLELTRQMSPAPLLVVEPAADLPFDRFAELIGRIRDADVEAFQLVGAESPAGDRFTMQIELRGPGADE